MNAQLEPLRVTTSWQPPATVTQTAFRSICFIYPDDGEGSRFDRMLPPLGLELVAAGVRDCVDDRCMIDLRFEKDWEARVPESTDLVAISMLWDKPIRDVFDLVRRLKILRPGVQVVAGGRVAEAHRETLVKAAPAERVDVVFAGPDDGRFRAFVESGEPDRIAGVSFMRNGEYNENPLPPYGAIPDRPLPDRTLRRANYRMIRRDGLDLGIASDTIQSSRGCSFKCSFCTFNRDQDGRPINFTMRSPESVADELAEIESNYVIFVDDNVAQDSDRIDRLCDLLLERGIHKTYGIETRINLGLRPQVAEKMARAGFRHITFGIEAIHDHTLKFLNKGFKRHTIEKAFDAIRGLPIIYTGNFIVGNVGETRAQMLEIPEFARRIGLDTIMVNHLRCRGPEPLTETVMATPDYHIDPQTRKVYSDALSLDEISAIIRQIKRDFWTPSQKLKTAWKARQLFRPVRYTSVARHWLSWKIKGKPDPWGELPTLN